MAERITLVCDGTFRGKQCDEEPERYVVTYPDGVIWTVDLCEKHSAQLRECAELGEQGVSNGKPRRGFVKTATTMDPL